MSNLLLFQGSLCSKKVHDSIDSNKSFSTLNYSHVFNVIVAVPWPIIIIIVGPLYMFNLFFFQFQKKKSFFLTLNAVSPTIAFFLALYLKG